MDRRRLADVRAGTAEQSRAGGSGYVVGPRLVLTARHVMVDDGGRPWPRVEVRLGHPGDGPPRRCAAALAWTDNVRDLALLRIDGVPFTDGPEVRWGWFTGSDPVDYKGLGFPGFVDYESGRGVEQLGGRIPPLAVGVADGYVLDQSAAPEPALAAEPTADPAAARETGRAWGGASGAAVFCEGLLVGVVATDDRDFANRRLHAVRIHTVLADPEFARLIAEDTGIPPVAEAVELKAFLQPPVGPARARTPGSLLAADVEAVDFAGRGTLLDDLAAWRNGPAPLSITLVVGEGGQGKTRLAREFAARTRRAGWVAGFTAAAPSGGAARDGRERGRALRDLARRLRASSRPVLLVADYAETRPDDIAVIAEELLSDAQESAVRLLLLSRTVGAWWDNLAETFPEEATQLIKLMPLSSNAAERRDAYVAAVTALAGQLGRLPEPSTAGEPAQPWPVLATRLTGNPRDLSDARFGNALTLQITALTDLLNTASGQQPSRLGKPEERALVSHERDYLHWAAARSGLLVQGV